MKFLFSWLKEFIELSVPPETLAARLTLAGLEVAGATRVDGDWLFEAEVTPNRPDCLSHLGIARETAAALGRPFRFPRWLAREMKLPRGTTKETFPVTVEDPEDCRRYVGIVIEGVRVAASPKELTERLTRIGVRPVNNVVDVTNYCLMEMGQPLHAFDLESLAGGEIRVRRARAGEPLVAIDETRLALSPGTLVIADRERAVALAGIMGGLETQITPKTRRVLVESACFAPALIRRGTRATRIFSDSSYRFERGVDLEMVGLAAIRAARMIADLAGGTVRLPVTDVGEKETLRPRIGLRPRRAQELLGARISPGQQRRILEHLGCQVKRTGRGLSVLPPSWRRDLNIPEDLYEELARLLGYERCPSTLPPVPRRAVAGSIADPWVAREARIKGHLVAAGAQEILTYSLLSPAQVSRCRAPGAVKLRNPLSAEQACLRPTLLCGCLEALSLNLRRKTASAVRFFELGQIFFPSGDGGVAEKKALGILVAGVPEPAWGRRPEPWGVFHLKGVLEYLWDQLGLAEVSEVVGPGPDFLSASCISFRWNAAKLAEGGSVHPGILKGMDLPPEFSAAYAEVDLERLAAWPEQVERIKPLPKVAPVLRDIALVVPEEVTHSQLREEIRRNGTPLLENTLLFDLYAGDPLPAGKKSLAFRLSFSSGDRTLTEGEVGQACQKIVQGLEKEFQATLRR